MNHRDLCSHYNNNEIGLGLNISKSLANALNGRLEFVSRKNVGSKFILKLPVSELEIDEYHNMMI